jgi:hypothetical protein
MIEPFVPTEDTIDPTEELEDVVDPASAGEDAPDTAMDAVHRLEATVHALTTRVDGIEQKLPAEKDASPIKRPWTHRLGKDDHQ